MAYQHGVFITEISDMVRSTPVAPPIVLPPILLSGPLAFPTSAVAGTLVANISNVPAGVTPTLTPNDGRLVIAGDAASGWKVVTGMTAANAGTIALSVSAAGAGPASANVVVMTPALTKLLSYIADLGDSRAAADFLNSAQTTRGALSPANWANGLSGAIWLMGPNFGVSGDRSDQMLARVDAAIASGAGTIRIVIGVNNFAQTSNTNTYTHAVSGAVVGSAQVAAQTFADVKFAADRIIAAGCQVVIEIEVGADNLNAAQTANVRSYNAMLVDYAAQTAHVHLHDARSVVLVDPAAATTLFKPFYSGDGVHLNGRGSFHHGKSLAVLLARIIAVPYFTAPARSAIPLPANGRNQLANNPVFAAGSGGTANAGVTGTVPGSCVAAIVGGATMTVAVNADPSGVGNNVSLSPAFAAINDAARLYTDVTLANWQPGDTVEGVAVIRVTGAANLKTTGLQLTISGTNAGTVANTNGTNQLTVTATDFRLPIGTAISGAGIPAGATITGQPAGGASTGVYTMSAAATATANAVVITAQVGPSTEDMNTGASNYGPDEDYILTLRTRAVTIPAYMTAKQFMQLGLRGIAAQAAVAGATNVTVLNARVNRLPSSPYQLAA